jgi:hypothetical protein
MKKEPTMVGATKPIALKRHAALLSKKIAALTQEMEEKQAALNDKIAKMTQQMQAKMEQWAGEQLDKSKPDLIKLKGERKHPLDDVFVSKTQPNNAENQLADSLGLSKKEQMYEDKKHSHAMSEAAWIESKAKLERLRIKIERRVRNVLFWMG